MDKIEVRAPAKINLFLKVLRKRGDGYHDIFSWFQGVDLFDNLIIERIAKEGISLSLENRTNLPINEENLIVKTAAVLFRQFKLNGGLNIRLRKNIPIAAGLGGGSSDAAATIYALNKIFNLHLSVLEMREIGLSIGSDVPFFFSSGQAEVTGRGEITRTIQLPTDYKIILICPSLNISTAESYRRLKMDLTAPISDIKLSCCNTFGELIGSIGNIGNDFEKVHLESYPILIRILDLLNMAGAALTRMSGSGPTIFGLFKNTPERSDLLKITQGDWQVMEVRPITFPAWD